MTGQNVRAQVLNATPNGDTVTASCHSRELLKNGWKGSLNSIPACYLTGFLLGKKAIEKEIKNAVLYIGKDHFTPRVAACLKGITEAGVQIPISEESLPPDDRISGQHIANYAQELKSDPQKYSSRFSLLLKNGLNPEDYPSHFEDIKRRISESRKETLATDQKEDQQEVEKLAETDAGKGGREVATKAIAKEKAIDKQKSRKPSTAATTKKKTTKKSKVKGKESKEKKQ